MFWGKIHLSALGMNLGKNAVGSILLVTHIGLLSMIWWQPMITASYTSIGWLSLSGFVGIVIGDTFFFRSLQILGPRRALVMATTAPLFGAALGWCLGERLQVAAFMGILLTLIGVSVVVSDRRAKQEAPGLMPGTMLAGILCGLGGALCQAAGGALSKLGLVDCEGLEATLIRILASLVCTLILAAAQRRLTEICRRICQRPLLKFLIPAAAMGTWLGVWLSQIAFKQAPLASALTLLATSPLFAIPIVHFYFGHKTSVLALVGSIVAITGIFIVVSYSGPVETTTTMPNY